MRVLPANYSDQQLLRDFLYPRHIATGMESSLNLVMFDIDGTLVKSYDIDEDCFTSAIEEVLGVSVNGDWQSYAHITDSGILNQIITEHGLSQRREEIHSQIKSKFVEKIQESIDDNKLSAVPGAPEFISRLQARDDVTVTIATGGWYESAVLKLNAVGIDHADIPIASSSDHYSRAEIMKIAEKKGGADSYQTRTYFGDADWDKEASSALGYNFILVGNRVKHDQMIEDFNALDDVIRFLDL